MGRTSGAIRAYERLATLEPDDVEHRVTLGRLYLERGDPHLAAASLWKARTISPKDDRLPALLLRAYGDLLAAELEAAIERGEGHPTLESIQARLRELDEKITSAATQEPSNE
jgi:hypothetical protein